jgi:hypothetical protein
MLAVGLQEPFIEGADPLGRFLLAAPEHEHFVLERLEALVGVVPSRLIARSVVGLVGSVVVVCVDGNHLLDQAVRSPGDARCVNRGSTRTLHAALHHSTHPFRRLWAAVTLGTELAPGGV